MTAVTRCYLCQQPQCTTCRLAIFGALVAAAIALVSCMEGCGASAELRAAYALEQARCIANERQIVERDGTTYMEDVEDLELERARCNAALRLIEQEER